jgi:hypothetical protein
VDKGVLRGQRGGFPTVVIHNMKILPLETSHIFPVETPRYINNNMATERRKTFVPFITVSDSVAFSLQTNYTD